ncbi:MAG TPA: hypothetical protein VFA29_07905, partial [Candidatus Baltobacteraceae bacterium]|nr:hypothetical protein [Candidatus Baltobacteraceae bacterium]
GRLFNVPGTIDTFPKGSTGNVTPSNQINVQYGHGPGGVALDYRGNLYVNIFNSNTVVSYPAGATGDATPTTVLSGSKTNFSNAEDVSL